MKNNFTTYVPIILIFTLLSACSKNETPSDDKQWIAGWRQTSSLVIPRAGAATIEANGFIYVIGGIDGKQFVPLVEYAQILADGQLGPWKQTSPLLEDRGFIDAVTARGYVYVVGGGNGPNGKNLLRSAERAKIMPGGELGPWETETNGLIMPRRCSKLV